VNFELGKFDELLDLVCKDAWFGQVASACFCVVSLVTAAGG